MELTLQDYSMVHYYPSQIAAAALCLSQQLLEGLQWVRDTLWVLFFSLSLSVHLYMLLQLLFVFSLPHSNTTLRIVRSSWGPSCSTWLKMWWRWTRGRQSSWWVGSLRTEHYFKTAAELLWFDNYLFIFFCVYWTAGCEEQVLQQEAAGGEPHPSAQVKCCEEHGCCCAQQHLSHMWTFQDWLSCTLIWILVETFFFYNFYIFDSKFFFSAFNYFMLG